MNMFLMSNLFKKDEERINEIENLCLEMFAKFKIEGNCSPNGIFETLIKEVKDKEEAFIAGMVSATIIDSELFMDNVNVWIKHSSNVIKALELHKFAASIQADSS